MLVVLESLKQSCPGIKSRLCDDRNPEGDFWAAVNSRYHFAGALKEAMKSALSHAG